MALYTILASSGDALKPCAIVVALSDEDATNIAGRLYRTGVLAFLPQDTLLAVRPSSNVEIAMMTDYMAIPPTTAASSIGRDEGFTSRSAARMISFYQDLWDGQVRSKNAKKRGERLKARRN